MPHACHALGCDTPVAPRFLMCMAHWRLVPATAKADVYATYRPGQERDKQPSAAYLQAAAVAVILVAKQTGQPIPPIWARLAAGKEE